MSSTEGEFVRITVPSTDNADERLTALQDDFTALLGALGGKGELIVRAIRVSCDTCDNRGPSAETFAAALAEAVAIGWTHHEDGTDECPDYTRQDQDHDH